MDLEKVMTERHSTRVFLGKPVSREIIVIGIALGYPDPESPINRTISERAPLHEVARFY